MYSLLFLGVVSFLLSSLLTPVVCSIFRRLGIVDEPDNARKLHQRAIPRVGGVAIALSYVLAFGLLLLTNSKGGAIVWEALPFAWRLFPAAGLVFTIGLLDDLIGLKPVQKLFGQIAASLVAYM